MAAAAKTEKKTRIVKLGVVSVDSGQVMILDPCRATKRIPLKTTSPMVKRAMAGSEYFTNDDADHDKEHGKKLPFSFAGTCETRHNKTGGGQLHFKNGVGAAVACSTGIGDGTFPVFVELDSKGSPLGLHIVFAQKR
jgi:hypothetical protein